MGPRCETGENILGNILDYFLAQTGSPKYRKPSEGFPAKLMRGDHKDLRGEASCPKVGNAKHMCTCISIPGYFIRAEGVCARQRLTA